MRILFTIVMFSVGAANADSIVVGSCPTPIIIELNGIWSGAHSVPERVNILNANPSRKAIVSAVFVGSGDEELTSTIMSLGSVDKFQGQIDDDTFNVLAETIASSITLPSSEFLERVEKAVDERSNTVGADINFTLDRNIESGDGFVVVYGQSTTSDLTDITGDLVFDTAGMFRHVGGCLININFGIPTSQDSLQKLHEAVYDLYVGH